MNNLETFSDLIEKHKFEITCSWAEMPKLNEILTQKEISIDTFENIYAIGVLEYLIGVLKKEKKIGDCPVMHLMLQEFAEHNLSSKEIFFICSQFKRVLTLFTFKHNFASSEIIDEINYILDENFSGVINIYDTILKQNTIDLEEKDKQLISYVEAINISSIVSRTDKDGIITYVNKEFENISGFTKEELIGSTHNLVRHPDMSKEFFKNLWDVIQSKQIFSATIKNRHKNSSAYFVKSFIIPILDINNEISEYISIRQNITDLVNALENEQKVNVLKDDFIRNMTHEIKTPLNIIAAATSMLIKRVNDPKLDKHMRMITQSTDDLLRLMNSIFELSKLNSGTFEITKLYVNIHQQLSDNMSGYKLLAEQNNITLSYEIDEKLNKDLPFDLVIIERILGALIDNAIKFNKSEGTIFIKVDYADQILNIQVKDSGIGMKSSEVDTIFDLFNQIDSSTTRHYEGAGLGLSITKKIVEYLNGTISVKSKPGVGSIFHVKIPL